MINKSCEEKLKELGMLSLKERKSASKAFSNGAPRIYNMRKSYKRNDTLFPICIEHEWNPRFLMEHIHAYQST